MSFTTNAPTPHHHQPEITPIDIWNFLCKAKWFVVGGMIVGCLIATIYLILTPQTFKSTVTLQLPPYFKNSNITIFRSNSEILESLYYDITIAEISKIMSASDKNITISQIKEALKNLSISKNEMFITISTLSNTPSNAQKISRDLANSISIYLDKENKPKIQYFKEVLYINK